MKSIFKKIAFVLALAMVVTMLPANAASAASSDAPDMYKSLLLYLDSGNGENSDITGAYKSERYASVWGWRENGYDEVTFESADTDIATVNSKGKVTAVKVGVTTVTATFTGEDVETVSKECKVTVKRNAAKVGLSADSAKKVDAGFSVGDELQLTAVRKDAEGNTEWNKTQKVYTTDSVRFKSSNEDVFKVMKTTGKLTATGEGEAVLTIWTVQSEGYDAAAKEYPQVVSKDYTVKVYNPGIVSVKQVSLTTAALTCGTEDTAAAIAKDFSKLTVTYKIGDNEITSFIKSATVDAADAKVVNVELYNVMNKDVEYKFTYNEKSVSLTAVDPDAIAAIRITTTTAQPGIGEKLRVDYLDANGVIIRGNDDYLSFEAADPNSTDYSVSAGEVYIYEAGKTATVKATYYMGFDAGGKQIPDLKAEQVIICKTTTANNFSGYAVAAANKKASDLNYGTGVLKLVNDENVQLYAKYTAKKYNGEVVTYYNESSIAEEKEGVIFKYKSTNDSIVLVDEATGFLYPVASGSAQIIIYSDKDVAVGAVTVSVEGSRVFASVSVDQAGLTKLSTADYGVNFRINAKDQLSGWLGQGDMDVSAKILNKSFNGTVYVTNTWGNYADPDKNEVKIVIDADEYTPIQMMNIKDWCGTVCGIGVETDVTKVQTLQISLKAERNGIVKYAVLNYTVKKPDAENPVSYAIDSAEIDVNFTKAKDSLVKEIKLRSYDKDGFLISADVPMTNTKPDDLAEGAFGYTVTKGTQNIALEDNKFSAVTVNTVSGSAVTVYKKVNGTMTPELTGGVDSVGTYVVRVTGNLRNSGGQYYLRQVAVKNIVVKDTTGAAAVTVSDNKVNSTDVASLVTEFNADLGNGYLVIKRDGNKVGNITIADVKLSGANTGNKVYVKSIVVTETNTVDGGTYNGNVHTYEIPVGKIFEVGQ